MASTQINIRLAKPSDIDFIISVLPRLSEFGPPVWRSKSDMLSVDTEVLKKHLINHSDESSFFVAEDAQGFPLGFIHLHEGWDYYYKEKHGHIADLIVAKEGEGRGIGRLLIERGEEWAKTKGYKWITLSVFAQNVHAREVYHRLGFSEDVIKYVKVLE